MNQITATLGIPTDSFRTENALDAVKEERVAAKTGQSVVRENGVSEMTGAPERWESYSTGSVGSAQPSLPDGYSWVKGPEGNLGIRTSEGKIVTDTQGKAEIVHGKTDSRITASDDVNLASSERTPHILYGDATGGGHLWPGGGGKSPFPASWSSSKIMNVVSDIASNPCIPERVQANGRIVKNKIVDGIDVKVVLEPKKSGGSIVTAFPTNVARNQK